MYVCFRILLQYGHYWKLHVQYLLSYPQRYNLEGNLEDIAPMTDFTCTGCHQRTWQFSPGEPRTRTFWSRAENSTDWATVVPTKQGRKAFAFECNISNTTLVFFQVTVRMQIQVKPGQCLIHLHALSTDKDVWVLTRRPIPRSYTCPCAAREVSALLVV